VARLLTDDLPKAGIKSAACTIGTQELNANACHFEKKE
jgi:hypothetical protein